MFALLIFLNLILINCSTVPVTVYNNTKGINITSCGEYSNPALPTDCYTYGTDTNSCCFFTYINLNGCVWLGKRFVGQSTYGALTLQCSSTYLKINIYSVLLLLLIGINLQI